MSASVDTTIVIWDLKGEVLATINTNQMTNSYAAVSPCGRLVQAAVQAAHLGILIPRKCFWVKYIFYIVKQMCYM